MKHAGAMLLSHGHRPAYTGLASLRTDFPDAPFLACTATATGEVKQGIIECLQLRSPVVLQRSFNSALLPLARVEMKCMHTIADICSRIVILEHMQVLTSEGQLQGRTSAIKCGTGRPLETVQMLPFFR